MKRKLLLLIALMANGLSHAWAYDFSAVAPSGQTLYYNITGGNAVVTYQYYSSSSNYSNLTGALVIPASVTYNGTTYSVTSIGDWAFYGCWRLTSVTIPNSVTSIGYCAFRGCSGLTGVTIPNSVTSIGNYAFQSCSSLTRVTIPNSVTSIGIYAFYSCSSLTSVTIPNSVTSIGTYAFCFCSGLTSVTIGNSVTSIGTYAFYGCSSLTSVTIPNSVTSIGGRAFYNCSGLTSVTIGNSVTSIGDYAFLGCSSLTSVTIPNSVTSIGQRVFDGCSSLASISVDAGNTHYDSRNNCNAIIETSSNTLIQGCKNTTIPSSVTYIGSSAFSGCSGLTSVTIPNSVTSIGEYAFSLCSGLTSVTMRGTVPPTLGGSVFYGNASNRKIYVPCGAYDNYYNANNGWSDYRNDLSDPIVDIDVTVNAESGKGSASIIPLRGQNVRCDSTIVVTATPNDGYHFDHWSTGSTQVQDTFAIEDGSIITAYFANNQCAVNVVSSDTVRGYVTGSDTIDYLDSITISAVANYGYHFTRWNDNDTHQVRTVQVTQNKTYTAYFDYNQYQLTVASANAVQGSCSGSGAYSYLANRTIQATANYGYHFTQWNDGNTDNPRTIQLTQDTIFTAEFAKNQYEITAVSDDESLGMVSGGGTFDYLDTITLTATTTAEHHHFVRWSDGNRENPRQWVVTEDHTLTAYFAIDTHRVTVVSNDLTRGMVTSSGSEFAYLNPCTVTATAYTGFVFTGWSNGVTATPYTFAVQSDVELTAIFVSEDELMFTITVETDDPTMGSVSGGGMAMSGGEVTIHAVANEGYHFVRWNDNNTNADRTVIVTEDATYTAYFAADQTEGINKVKQMPTIVVRGNSIAVGNAQNQMLSIYDITGRMIVREQAVDGKQYTMPHSGVYMVQVGNHPAEKVVVIR